MFSLLITLASIALVVAIAMATMFYGAQTATRAVARADATAVAAQGRQIMSAAELFFSKERRWPASLAELADNHYLRSMPVPPAGLGQWTQPSAGVPTFVVQSPVSEQVCRELNRVARGDDGILRQARQSLVVQCYGEALSSLKVVITKSATNLVAALPAAEQTALGIPADPQSADWLISPGAPQSLPGPGGAASGSPGGGSEASGPWVLQAQYTDPADSQTYTLPWGNGASGIYLESTDSATRSITVRIVNTGVNAGTFGLGWVSDGHIPELVVSADACSGVRLAPGAQCTVTLTLSELNNPSDQSGVAHLAVVPNSSSFSTMSASSLPAGSQILSVNYFEGGLAMDVMQFNLTAAYTNNVGGYGAPGVTLTLQSTRPDWAPLQELNPFDAFSSGADDELQVTFGGYRATMVQSPSVSVSNLTALHNTWSTSLSTSAPAGSTFTFSLAQPQGAGTILSMTLESAGTDTATWCVDLVRDTVNPKKWQYLGLRAVPGACSGS